MVYHVILVGHSLVPRSLPVVEGCAADVGRKPGRKIQDIYEDPVFQLFRESHHDLAIIHIGGNDLVESSVVEVCHKLRDLCMYALQRATKATFCMIVQKLSSGEQVWDNR